MYVYQYRFVIFTDALYAWQNVQTQVYITVQPYSIMYRMYQFYML